jgi:hypothetical protein
LVSCSSAVRALWIAVLVALAAMKTGVASGDDRHGMASACPDGFGYARGWSVHVGEMCADTLDIPWGQVLPVAATVLAGDEWRIQSTDHIRGRIVTEWQPVRHRLVNLFLGQVRERCVVDVTPLGTGSCVVQFRAGLATRESVRGNPLLPAVNKAYLKGVRDWQLRVREALGSRGMRG